jgi:hypothetical protein
VLDEKGGENYAHVELLVAVFWLCCAVLQSLVPVVLICMLSHVIFITEHLFFLLLPSLPLLYRPAPYFFFTGNELLDLLGSVTVKHPGYRSVMIWNGYGSGSFFFSNTICYQINRTNSYLLVA